jgi:hypothetical protein
MTLQMGGRPRRRGPASLPLNQSRKSRISFFDPFGGGRFVMDTLPSARAAAHSRCGEFERSARRGAMAGQDIAPRLPAVWRVGGSIASQVRLSNHREGAV